MVDEFIAHARAIRAERARAAAAGEAPRLPELIDGWGGVTIAYRRRLIDSPSYTLNHEEVEKALEEGIRFAEGLTPTRDRRRTRPAMPSASSFQTREAPSARCRRAPCWSRRARGPTPCWRARMREQVRLDGQYFQALNDDGAAGEAGKARQADEVARHAPSCAPTAAPSASSAICIPPSPATW